MANQNSNIDYTELKTPERVEKLKRVLEKRLKTFTVVMENVHDPHNLSAAVRSCDAVGIYDIHMIYHKEQERPKLGRQSSGSARKWVDQHFYTDIDSCYNKLRSEGKKIFTTHLGETSKSLYDLDLTDPIALVFGNEHSGVSQEAVDKADGNFIIPQVGMIQSLNISVAVAVSVYEVFRQRSKSGMFDSIEFDKNEFDVLLNEWLSR